MLRFLHSGVRGRMVMSAASLAFFVTATAAFAAVPDVVVDSQIAGPGGFSSPQSIAMAPNNTYYVADAGNNRVLAFTGTQQTTVATPGFTLVAPEALAVDSAGDLFIGDAPTSGTGRVIEAIANNGVLNGTARQVVLGGPLQDVSALAVDAGGNLYVGDDVSAAVYTLAAGSSNLVKLNAGLPADLDPAALLKDNAGDLFIADFNSTLYEVPAGAGSAQTYVIPGFVVWSPTGFATDPQGNLYVLTLTSTEPTTAQPVPENIIEVPFEANDGTGALNPADAYRVPFTGPQNASGIAIDSQNSIYVLDFINNNITKILYGTPIDLGSTALGQYGSAVTANFEVNARVRQAGFAVSSRGDIAQGNSAEVVNQLNTCQPLVFKQGSNGGAISPSNPYLCQTQWVANPLYPGVRTGAIELLTPSGAAAVSIGYREIGLSAASAVYPLTATKTIGARAGSPISLAISGLDQTLYEVDYSKSLVFSYNGPTGTTRTKVKTAPISLFTPTGVAVNNEGDVYITEGAFNLSTPGYVVVVPALKGEKPYTLNPGGLLNHPLSVTFDSAGDLLIGDSGPAGMNADPSNPGYIVEVPAGGGPAFKLNTGSIPIILPLTIAAQPFTGDVYVGDGGELTESNAKIVEIPAGGGNAKIVTPVSDPDLFPTAIAFGPSGAYYLVDQNANTITVVPPDGSTPYSLPFTSKAATSLSALVVTNSGQSLVVGSGPSTASPNGALIYLNGKDSTVDFGKVPKGQQSAVETEALVNVGTAPLQLGQPYVTPQIAPPFSIATTTTCASLVTVAPADLCNLDLQFSPTTRGKQTQQFNFQTNGYSPNPIFTLTGRGGPKQ